MAHENLNTRRRAFLRRAGLVGLATAVPGSPTLAVPPPRTQNAPTIAPPPSMAHIALNRLAFGPRPGDIATFNTLGADDEARLNAYIDQQLDPDSIDDSDFEARMAIFNASTLNKSLTQLWQQHFVADPEWQERMRPFFETERATFVRAMYSQKQLNEVLADFWHNHFNVYAQDYYISPIFVHYDRDVIRGHMWGNFLEFLTAVAQSTAMLYYLDNVSSSRAGPNENWARELFELHTLGAEHYAGVMPQDDVPKDGNGIPVAYVDNDIYEATRCFTGWTVNPETGEFMLRDDWHDRFQKKVLSPNASPNIPADQTPLQDGEMVLELVATHPGTARHISRKLIRRLISDTPSEALVESAAQIFLDNTTAPDQLKLVVEHIIRSETFRATWGEKTKRPFEYVMSAFRALDVDLTIRPGHGDSDNFMWQYDATGQPLFQWRPPNGFPDVSAAWQSTAPLLMSWRIVKWICSMSENYEETFYYADIIGQTPSNLTSATQLTDFWIDRLLQRPLSSDARQIILDFMAQDDDPDAELPIFQEEWPGPQYRNRLRTMVALILNTPEFHLR